ncbi:Alpha-L-fucosidase [Cohnella sp. OV330]|uniref:alpha-L-fucosidase n=1 Tax=Cohnella sp. OV330 TaxID=1855288 RepID=UPI0008DF4185|nr:alpha-L-fucosidase [Cohnella sp. OV330]SFA74993.1 Alpha-L-fucosidase [Cohnella sp. OV330]
MTRSIMMGFLKKNALFRMLLIAAMLIGLAIPRQQASAQTYNANTDWFMQGKYGLFVQWLYGGGDMTGDWNTLVNGFNVARFAQQANESGAKYVIFTLGQNSGYFASPNATYDLLTGRTATTTKMSTRDLPMDLYDALAPYGIKLMLYLPARTPSDDPGVGDILGDPAPIYDHLATQDFQAKWESIIQEWSDRYGSKVAGWWFDGTYNNGAQYGKPDISQAYTDYTKAHNFQTFAAAAKHGNANAIVAFDPGLAVDLPMTTHADYITGEQNQLSILPSQANAAPYTRWIGGIQWSETAYQGNDWNSFGLKYTTPYIVDYLSKVTNQSGVLSFGPHVDKTGNINAPQLAQLVAIKNGLLGKGPGVQVTDDADAAFAYAGTWGTSIPSGTGYYSNTGHFTKTPGSYVQYTFNGTNVVWSGVKGPDHGTADVYIDNVLDQSVNLYAANRFVDTEIYSKTGLAPGSHTIKIVARSDKDAASTDYYVEVDRMNVATGMPTVTDDTASGIAYSGTWPTSVPTGTGYYGDTGHFSTTSASYAQYTFTGKSIEWYGVLGPDHGKADVYIDGTLDQTVDLYNAERYIDTLLYTKRNLSAGSHTIKIVVRSDRNASSVGNYVEVDRFNVSQGTPVVTRDDTHPSWNYTGTWLTSVSGVDYYKHTGHYTSTAGSFAEASFTGTSVEWVGKLDADHGKADVYIDGTLDRTVDLYSPNRHTGITVYNKQGLSGGNHTIKIVARSDKNVIATNYYVEVDALIYQ